MRQYKDDRHIHSVGPLDVGGQDVVPAYLPCSPQALWGSEREHKESSVKLTESEKKMFKEAFNTDKTRLEKRHAKYDKPANFLILVEDNVHQAGPCGAGTAGITMVYGRGKLMDQYQYQEILYLCR